MTTDVSDKIRARLEAAGNGEVADEGIEATPDDSDQSQLGDVQDDLRTEDPVAIEDEVGEIPDEAPADDDGHEFNGVRYSDPAELAEAARSMKSNNDRTYQTLQNEIKDLRSQQAPIQDKSQIETSVLKEFISELKQEAETEKAEFARQQALEALPAETRKLYEDNYHATKQQTATMARIEQLEELVEKRQTDDAIVGVNKVINDDLDKFTKQNPEAMEIPGVREMVRLDMVKSFDEETQRFTKNAAAAFENGPAGKLLAHIEAKAKGKTKTAVTQARKNKEGSQGMPSGSTGKVVSPEIKKGLNLDSEEGQEAYRERLKSSGAFG